MKLVAALLAALLVGCSVLESPTTFAVCKAADVTTTIVAVHSGIGTEANPLMKPLVAPMLTKLTVATALPFIAVSAALVWAVYEADNPKVTTVASATTCSVAAHNAYLLGR
jgi:hypothetical protein